MRTLAHREFCAVGRGPEVKRVNAERLIFSRSGPKKLG